MNSSVKNNAYKLVYWQIIMVMVLALILFLLQGIKSGASTLLGGFAYALPNWVFVWRVFSYSNARAAKKFIIAFFAGEAFKLIISGILFVLAVKFLPVCILPLLIGFIGAIVAFWAVSFYMIFQQEAS